MLTQRRKLNRSTSPIRRYLSKRCGAFDAPVHSPPGLWDAGRTDGLAFVVCPTCQRRARAAHLVQVLPFHPEDF